MFKLATKKDGATTTCKNCDTDLICRLKDYGGNYPPVLQWQNYDGTAHYKTDDGKNYVCNIPDEDEVNQTRITSVPSTPGDAPKSVGATEILLIRRMDEKIDLVFADIQRIKEFVEPIFLKMVDDQIRREK